MKKRNLSIILIFFAICLSALIYKNGGNLYKEYIVLFKKNAILTNYNVKGQLNGEFIKYVGGKIEVKANFINGLKDGWTMKYYDNGQVENKIYYIHDRAEGAEYEYYKNGKLNYIRYWKNDKQYGNYYWYFENGKLDSYSTNDILGKSFCVYHYSQSGKLVKMDGFVFSFNIYSLDEKGDSTMVFNYSPYHLYSKYHYIKDLYITVATPPGLIPLIEVDINNRTLKNLKVTDNTVKIPNAFPVKDTYQIFIISHLVDKKDSVVNGINMKATIIKE